MGRPGFSGYSNGCNIAIIAIERRSREVTPGLSKERFRQTAMPLRTEGIAGLAPAARGQFPRA
jgi:hypothetical protein